MMTFILGFILGYVIAYGCHSTKESFDRVKALWARFIDLFIPKDESK